MCFRIPNWLSKVYENKHRNSDREMQNLGLECADKTGVKTETEVDRYINYKCILSCSDLHLYKVEKFTMQKI